MSVRDEQEMPRVRISPDCAVPVLETTFYTVSIITARHGQVVHCNLLCISVGAAPPSHGGV